MILQKRILVYMQYLYFRLIVLLPFKLFQPITFARGRLFFRNLPYFTIYEFFLGL